MEQLLSKKKIELERFCQHRWRIFNFGLLLLSRYNRFQSYEDFVNLTDFAVHQIGCSQAVSIDQMESLTKTCHLTVLYHNIFSMVSSEYLWSSGHLRLFLDTEHKKKRITIFIKLNHLSLYFVHLVFTIHFFM